MQRQAHQREMEVERGQRAIVRQAFDPL
jgi:hypothetical protein